MKTSKILAIATTVAITMSSFTFAIGADVAETKIAAPDMMPIYNQKKFYKFDTKGALKLFTDKTSTLQEVTCPSEALMKQAGILNNRKWTNVTYEDTDAKMNVSYDFVNCYFNGYTTLSYDQNATLKPITEETALATAKAFIASSFIKDVMAGKLGEPIVTSKYNYSYPVPMPMPIDARSSLGGVAMSATPVVSPDYIDKDEFTHITVLFPYVIDGMKVYSNYGGRQGISIEVTERGVSSYNGQLISLPNVKKDAKPMTNTQFISYIKRGGNNPYYGTKSSVALNVPERIYALVQDWRNNKTTTYLATATLFPSSLPMDEYAPWNIYEMVITDYKFANSNMITYPKPMY